MKTLSADEAAAEISRLPLLRGFPADNPIAMKSLIEILQKWFTGATRNTYPDGPEGRCVKEPVSPREQLGRVIDLALERFTGWYSPAQLREVLNELYPLYGGRRIC